MSILKLEKLLTAANNEAERWREESCCDLISLEKEEEYFEYRAECFAQIWNTFWKIAEKIGIPLDKYYSSTDSLELVMRRSTRDYERNNPS